MIEYEASLEGHRFMELVVVLGTEARMSLVTWDLITVGKLFYSSTVSFLV